MVKVSDAMRRKIRGVLVKHDVSRAGIFGSYARGESTKKSDLDLVVAFKKKKSLLDLATLELALEKSIHKKADVVTYDSLHPLLKLRVLKEQVQIL
jgi:uncharacterized protein